MNNLAPLWRPDQDAILADMWTKGSTARDIAGIIGEGRTSNAVIGRVRRLKLKIHPRLSHSKVTVRGEEYIVYQLRRQLREAEAEIKRRIRAKRKQIKADQRDAKRWQKAQARELKYAEKIKWPFLTPLSSSPRCTCGMFALPGKLECYHSQEISIG